MPRNITKSTRRRFPLYSTDMAQPLAPLPLRPPPVAAEWYTVSSLSSTDEIAVTDEDETSSGDPYYSYL